MTKFDEYKQIMLLVTEDCNLNCLYCYEHDKNSKSMSFETAKKIIDTSFSNIHNYKGAIIELFGGEAFLNFELIKEIDQYIMEEYSDIDIIFENTTNGTLIHGEIQKWLKNRKDRYEITVSLDGTKEMHNVNRTYNNNQGSYDSIDVGFFISTWESCAAKMTISEKTLPMLAEGVKHIESLGFDCMASLAIGLKWNFEDNVNILIRELGKLVHYYSENPNQKLCQLLSYDFKLLFFPLNEKFRYCGAGIHMVCFDTKGDCYPCQGFAPISIGYNSKEFLNFNSDNFAISVENPCKTCKWIRICRTCYAANYQATGNTQLQCKDMCYFNRLCILASSKIQFNRIATKAETLTNDEQMLLKAIDIIQNDIMTTSKV